MKDKIEKPNPIIVSIGGWEETLPDWLFKRIQAERMINGMSSMLVKDKTKSKELIEEVSDTEALVYLCTASSQKVLDSHHTNIYLYLTRKIMIEEKKITKENIKDFEFLNIEKLDEYEERALKDLKQHIFRSRGGKIKHPILSFLKEFQKECKKKD